MGDRGAAGGAWGARNEAAWWPGAGELQHQQQINEEIARSTAANTQQLYTYKMTGSFSSNTNETANSNFDYRMIPNTNAREESTQQPWWYSSGTVESHQSSSPTEQNQSSPDTEQNRQQEGIQQQQLQVNQSLQQQLQQQNLQQQHSDVQVLHHVNQSLQQSQQQTLQQMLQQNQQQQQQHHLEHQQQQEQQQQHQNLQNQQNQQQALQNQQQQALQNQQQALQNLHQTLSQSQAQAIVQAAALQQQVAQTLQQQQQTLQDHIQAIQQQQIQAALQRQSATLQELQQQQQQALVNQATVPKGRMPRAKPYNKPRGRMTAYAFFLQTCREEHRKKHPDENVIFAVFSKKCAERWNTMSEKEKARFHEMAEQDKKRYELEMASYVPPKDANVKIGGGRTRKRTQIKDPNAPKRSLSAFFWFCNDERSKVKANNPEYTMGDIAKELGRRWAAADPEAKAKYEALSEQDKARYDREMTAYKKGPLVLVHQPQQTSIPDDIDEEIGEFD